MTLYDDIFTENFQHETIQGLPVSTAMYRITGEHFHMVRLSIVGDYEAKSEEFKQNLDYAELVFAKNLTVVINRTVAFLQEHGFIQSVDDLSGNIAMIFDAKHAVYKELPVNVSVIYFDRAADERGDQLAHEVLIHDEDGKLQIAYRRRER